MDDNQIDEKFSIILSELTEKECFKPRATKLLQYKTYISQNTRRIVVLWLENLEFKKTGKIDQDVNRNLKTELVFGKITQEQFLNEFIVEK